MMTQSLCEACRNVREVRTARSLFLLCGLSVTDAAYPKYPPQPVERCDGYEPRADTGRGERGRITPEPGRPPGGPAPV